MLPPSFDLLQNTLNSSSLPSKCSKSYHSYLNCVVSPLQHPEEKYFVEAIVQNMNPASTLSNNKTLTFAQYYRNK